MPVEELASTCRKKLLHTKLAARYAASFVFLGGIEMIEALDQAIKKIWTTNLKQDYEKGWLWREDSLKAALYYHLRQELGDQFFENHRVRIITELNLRDYIYRIDLVIIKLNEDNQLGHSDILAMVEFKYKDRNCPYDVITRDVQKFNVLRKDTAFENTRFYVAILHEEKYHRDQASWLDGRQRRWASKLLTELSGFKDVETGDLVMVVPT